jgi:hypothetical protein
MKRWISNLFATSHKPARSRSATRRPRRLYLGVESLEDRVVQSVTPLSMPSDVSTQFLGGQTLHSQRTIAEDAKGDFRVVWEDNAVLTRLFDSTGKPLTDEVQLTSAGASDSQATVGMDAAGDAVIAWTHTNADGTSQVRAKVVGTTGQQGSTIYLPARKGCEPSVVVDSASDALVAYTERGGSTPSVHLAWVDLYHGYEMGDRALGVSNAYQPSLSSSGPYGSAVVAVTHDFSPTDQDVYAQRLSWYGAPQGGLIPVATSGRAEFQPSVAADARGGFVVAYTYTRSTSQVDLGPFGHYTDYQTEVHADRFDAQNRRLGPTLTVAATSDPSVNGYTPSVASDASGDFLVAYTYGGSYYYANGNSGTPTVHASAYTSTGALINANLDLSSSMISAQGKSAVAPSVAMSADGHIAADWVGSGVKWKGEFSASGVYAQALVNSPYQYQLLGGNTVHLTAGFNTSLAVEITRDAGFTGPVNLTIPTLPAGVSYTVSPPSVMFGRTEVRTITFTAADNAPGTASFNTQLRISSPGGPTLTPALQLDVTAAGITGWSANYSTGWAPAGSLLRGYTATISGHGFVPGSVVQFGRPGVNDPSARAVATNVTSTSLTVLVPAGAKPGPITVIRPGHAALVSSSSAQYTEPSVTGMSQSYGYPQGGSAQFQAAGSSVTVYGVGFLPGTQVQFGSGGKARATSVDPRGGWLTVNVPADASSGKLKVILPNGTALQSSQNFTVIRQITLSQQVVTGWLDAFGGSVDITLDSLGNVTVHWHFHDGGLESYDFHVSAVVTASILGADGTQLAIAAQQSGHVGGGITGWTVSESDRNFDRTDYYYNPQVAQYFDSFRAGAHLQVLQDHRGDVTGPLADIGSFVVKAVAGLALGATGTAVIFLGVEAGSLISSGSLVPGARLLDGVLWLAGPNGTLFALAADAITKVGSHEKELPQDAYDWAQNNVFGGTLPSRDQIVVSDTIGPGNRPFTWRRFDGKIVLNMGPDGYNNLWTFDGRRYGQTLVHELTHVWQIAHRPELGIIAEAAGNKVTELTQGQDAEYTPLPPDVPFSQDNLEQQATIVEYWYAGKDEFKAIFGHDSAFGSGALQPADATHSSWWVKDNVTDPYYRYIAGNIRAGIP